jgi:hypothetical protein
MPHTDPNSPSANAVSGQTHRSRCVEGTVDIFRVHRDGSEDLLASGLPPAELDGLREWFCYTKPLGCDVRIEIRPSAAGGCAFSLLAAGTEPEPADGMCTQPIEHTTGRGIMRDGVFG